MVASGLEGRGQGAGVGRHGGQSQGLVRALWWGSLLGGQPGCGLGPVVPAALEGGW